MPVVLCFPNEAVHQRTVPEPSLQRTVLSRQQHPSLHGYETSLVTVWMVKLQLHLRKRDTDIDEIETLVHTDCAAPLHRRMEHSIEASAPLQDVYKQTITALAATALAMQSLGHRLDIASPSGDCFIASTC